MDILLLVDALLCLSFGAIGYAAPKYMLSLFTVTESDGVQWHLFRCFCGVLISQGWTWLMYARRNVADKQILSAMYTTRCIASVFAIFLMLTVKAFLKDQFRSNVHFGAIIFFILVLVLYLRRLFLLGWPIAQRLPNGFPDDIFNFLARFDGIMSLLIGVLWIGFPDVILYRQVKYALTPLTIWIGRLMGCSIVATMFISNAAPYFATYDDRLTAVYTRSWMTGGTILAQIYSQWAYHAWWKDTHWVGISLNSIWAICSFGLSFFYTFQRGPNSVKME